MNKKALLLADKIQKLRGSYRGKLFRKWSHRNGVSVAINASSDTIFSDDVANNIDVFLVEEVSKDSLTRYVFMESLRKHKLAKASGVRSVNHCPIAIRLSALVCGKMGYSISF